MQRTFAAGFADDTMTLEEIRRVYERTGCVLDPHTAVASHVLQEYRERTGDHTPTVLVATASPYKVAPDVLRALTGKNEAAELDAFACAEKLSQLTGTPVPRQIAELKDLPVRHTVVCDKERMGDTLLAELSK